MPKIRRVAAGLWALAALGCDSTEPDLEPTLQLDVPTMAVAGEPLSIEATLGDDRLLEGLVVTWGDGAGEGIVVSGATATVVLEHTYTTLGTFEVQATVQDGAGQTTSRSATIEIGPASVVIDQAGGDTINAIGYTATLTAHALDAAGEELSDFQADWESLDATTASVDAEGLVTAVAPGEARIRAARGAAADTVVVLVRQVAKAVELTVPDTLGVRQGVAVGVIVTDSNDVAVAAPEFTLTSTAPGVASVDAEGTLAGHAEGHVEIVAMAGPAADTAEVEVALMILFAKEREGTHYPELFTMTRHGTDLRNLTNYEFSDLDGAWSPDRKRIAFWSSRTESGVIMLMNDDGSDVQELHTGLATAYDVAWSPAGDRLAFAGRVDGARDDIYVIDVDGSGLTPLAADTAHERSPAWSPDGLRIAFERVVSGSPDIHVMDADGSDVVRLTTSLTTEMAPVWSPDGERIAFTGDITAGTGYGIHVMDADGGNITRIGDQHVIQFDWSPEGDWFAYAAQVDGQWDLFLLPAAGGEPVRLTDDPEVEQDVRWR